MYKIIFGTLISFIVLFFNLSLTVNYFLEKKKINLLYNNKKIHNITGKVKIMEDDNDSFCFTLSKLKFCLENDLIIDNNSILTKEKMNDNDSIKVEFYKESNKNKVIKIQKLY